MPESTSFESWLAVIAFVSLSAAFSLAELVRPLRPLRQFGVGLGMDIVGLAIATLVSSLVTGAVLWALTGRSALPLPPALDHPVGRGLLFLLLTDLSRFLTHLWMHRGWMWRFHEFHHSPVRIYWLSGNRVTPVHVVLFSAPTAFFTWALAPGAAVLAGNVVLMVFWNHFMHTNLKLGNRLQRMLEWVVTTPRYHHIHHAREPHLHGKNLASLFTFWDHLCNTYVNPDHVSPEQLDFGVAQPRTRSRLRMVLGL